MNDLDIDPAPSPAATRVAGVSARPVPLADGRPWGLALPGPRYRPEVVPGVDALGRPIETTRLAARVGYPAPIERHIADLRAACVAVGPAGDPGRFEALMALAVALLRRAHDLSLAEAVGLLDLDEEGLSRLVDAVLAAVAGIADDPSPDPEPTPTGGGNA